MGFRPFTIGLLALLSIGAAPAKAPVETAPTGRMNLVFSERSALSYPEALAQRLGPYAFVDIAHATPTEAARNEYDVTRESFDVVVPQGYRPDVPHGLFVWVGVTEYSPEWLEVLGTIGGVKAVRRILHTSPDSLSQTPLFAENLRRLPAYDLAFDLCLRADQLLTVGKPLVEKCPHVQFVLDHCGVPDIAGAGLDPWRGAIAELAMLPNLACKVSGIIAYAGENPTAATLKPYVEHVVASFGWERVVWGSDHPVCTANANLTKWVGITRELIAGASADEQARLLTGNAKRLYRV